MNKKIIRKVFLGFFLSLSIIQACQPPNKKELGSFKTKAITTILPQGISGSYPYTISEYYYDSINKTGGSYTNAGYAGVSIGSGYMIIGTESYDFRTSTEASNVLPSSVDFSSVCYGQSSYWVGGLPDGGNFSSLIFLAGSINLSIEGNDVIITVNFGSIGTRALSGIDSGCYYSPYSRSGTMTIRVANAAVTVITPDPTPTPTIEATPTPTPTPTESPCPTADVLGLPPVYPPCPPAPTPTPPIIIDPTPSDPPFPTPTPTPVPTPTPPEECDCNTPAFSTQVFRILGNPSCTPTSTVSCDKKEDVFNSDCFSTDGAYNIPLVYNFDFNGADLTFVVLPTKSLNQGLDETYQKILNDPASVKNNLSATLDNKNTTILGNSNINKDEITNLFVFWDQVNEISRNPYIDKNFLDTQKNNKNFTWTPWADLVNRNYSLPKNYFGKSEYNTLVMTSVFLNDKYKELLGTNGKPISNKSTNLDIKIGDKTVKFNLKLNPLVKQGGKYKWEVKCKN